jgi:hypothetical protein
MLYDNRNGCFFVKIQNLGRFAQMYFESLHQSLVRLNDCGRSFLALVLAFAVLGQFAPRTTFAQPAGRGEVELAGSFEGAQGGMVRLKDPQGNFVMGIVDQRGTSISYRGKADRAVLKPGTFVRFAAPATPEGIFLAPVSEVEMYVPNPEVLKRRATPLQMSLTHPGIYVMSAITPLQPGGSPDPEVRIVGKIIAIEEASMALLCGDRPLKIEIEPEMRVALNMPSLEWAQSGDKITGKGAFNPETRQLMIRSLVITGSKTLGTELAAQNAQMAIPEKKLTAKEKALAKKEEALAKKLKKSVPDTPEMVGEAKIPGEPEPNVTPEK